MAAPPFSWMWGDPSESIDRIREMRSEAERYEKIQAERQRIKKARRIRKLVKLAKAGKLKRETK